MKHGIHPTRKSAAPVPYYAVPPIRIQSVGSRPTLTLFFAIPSRFSINVL
jgi:hypothetical protein